MRILVQRVSRASVTIEGKTFSSIDAGLLVFLGIEQDDTVQDSDWLVQKLTHLRIFDDQQGIMNRSLVDTDGELLVVSQFTLHASTRKGNRPSYIRAAKPEIAIPLYEDFIKRAQQELGKPVQTGSFGACMQVKLINDGPVTIWIDSKNKE